MREEEGRKKGEREEENMHVISKEEVQRIETEGEMERKWRKGEAR